jgi:hypothetical protein
MSEQKQKSAGNKSSRRLAGYCALCCAKEIELYGTVVNTTGAKHISAVEQAGCGHPAVYALAPDARDSKSRRTP